jgi:aspartate aminotransferase-like enzyme
MQIGWQQLREEEGGPATTTIDPKVFRDINPGDRLLMGPGPSDVSARVLQALAAPCIGHLDPYFLATMNETQQLLRHLFQTANALTIPVSATGSAGMEACFVNLVECGDEVVVAVNGVFGTQKCISCPPGLSPVTFSATATKTLEQRKSPVVSWYLDLSMVRDYWGSERKYHHTAPVNMVYAIREALRIIAEEGLEARFARHRLNHRALVAGIEAMGLSMLVPEKERLPMLNAVRIPDGVNDATVRKALLNDFAIEIGGGLGQFAGKVWRVGLMGHSCRRKNVFLFLSALEAVLKAEGFKARPGAIEAATAVYSACL